MTAEGRRGGGAEGRRYRVLVGLSYPPGKRAERGDLVDDLPQTSVDWLLGEGCIELVQAVAGQGRARTEVQA